ncbi:pentapeptide repeat-containing protein [Marinicellulosiphila megalodicopiae]|uniref:pentapeptide repeat-containing protein n=1 Tax=Marinicellulosiphila megalodicopiae TaxID=2724896 RepID=UPI003BB0E3EE
MNQQDVNNKLFQYAVNLKNNTQDVSLLDFSGEQLEGLTFENLEVNDINFKGANLKNAIFRNFEAFNINFEGANLDNVQVENSHLNGKREGNIDEASFKGVNIKNTSMQQFNAENTDFTDAELERVQIHYVDFDRAVLKNTSLKNMELQSCNFDNANFTGSQFKSAVLSCVKFDAGQFDNAQLINMNIDEAEFLNTKFNATKIRNSDLSVDLTGVNFTDVLFENTQVKQNNSECKKAIFKDVVVRNSYFGDLEYMKSEMFNMVFENSQMNFDDIGKGIKITGMKLLNTNIDGFDLDDDDQVVGEFGLVHENCTF